MTTRRLQIALVFGGDSEVRRLVTRENNRFAAVFAAFAARGIEAHPAVYNRAQLDELREQLLQVDGALVWVNPIGPRPPAQRCAGPETRLLHACRQPRSAAECVAGSSRPTRSQ